MANNNAFTPLYGDSDEILNISTSSGSVNLPSSTQSNSIVLTNSGLNSIYVVISTNPSVTATAGKGYIVLPNTQIALGKPQGQCTMAYITRTGTSSLHYVLGEGL